MSSPGSPNSLKSASTSCCRGTGRRTRSEKRPPDRGARRMLTWDLAAGRELLVLRGHEAPVWSAAFYPDGSKLVSAPWDKSVRLWDLAKGRELLALHGHEHGVNSVAFSPDDGKLASASFDSTVRLWDLATGGELLVLRGREATVCSVAFSPDGSKLADAS